MVFCLAAAAATLLAAAGLLVHGSPCTALGFALGNAAMLIPLLDMLGLSFLLVRISGFVTAWHRILLKARDADVQVAYRYKRKAAKRWHTLALSVILKRT